MNYYDILGINQNADLNIIKKAYRKLVTKWHPDKNLNNKIEAEKNFKLITEAYETLKDNNKRFVYNNSLNNKNYFTNNRHTYNMNNFFSNNQYQTNNTNIKTYVKTFIHNGRKVVKKTTVQIDNGNLFTTEEIIYK